MPQRKTPAPQRRWRRSGIGSNLTRHIASTNAFMTRNRLRAESIRPIQWLSQLPSITGKMTPFSLYSSTPRSATKELHPSLHTLRSKSGQEGLGKLVLFILLSLCRIVQLVFIVFVVSGCASFALPWSHMSCRYERAPRPRGKKIPHARGANVDHN
ncbi:hypothetical protein IWZ03DRAFT_49564 [Phyllosticta citriasiana]|uniref:Uncharacterized protein n=1 Tax=Phyllosticta citriasiana TaxID=595635 RepID=A0ABR1KEI6_9PEZI